MKIGKKNFTPIEISAMAFVVFCFSLAIGWFYTVIHFIIKYW
jgi:hypothetical protein